MSNFIDNEQTKTDETIDNEQTKTDLTIKSSEEVVESSSTNKNNQQQASDNSIVGNMLAIIIVIVIIVGIGFEISDWYRWRIKGITPIHSWTNTYRKWHKIEQLKVLAKNNLLDERTLQELKN